MSRVPAKSILHPTDFSETSEAAFAHALAIAVRNKARLTILHVTRDAKRVPWTDYPSVRRVLERWGHLEPGSSRSDLFDVLGLEVKKAFGVESDVVKSIVGFTESHDIDLIVMATDENQGLPFWARANVSVPVAQRTKLPTLFVPRGVPGCVSLEDGSTTLDHVLFPVDHQPSSQPAMDRVVATLRAFGGSTSSVTVLHVGAEDRFPKVVPPAGEEFSWSNSSRSGEAAGEIVDAARELNANLIVMVTEGEKGLWDALRGSTVQRVLRAAPCPIFAIPSPGS